MVRLGINIDHVATVRNARGGRHPDPILAAKTAEKFGADSIVVHLREDRRHIKDEDVRILRNQLNIPLQLEIAATDFMLDFALKNNIQRVCLVPENRKELTTESGLDLKSEFDKIYRIVSLLNEKDIFSSLFLDPVPEYIQMAAEMKIKAVELHTGFFSEADGASEKQYFDELNNSAKMCKEHGIEVHAGHGLNFDKLYKILDIYEIEEVNIGHFIIGESIFTGLEEVINKMKSIIKKKLDKR